ncbi:MAG TPA: PIG-L family deacetylase [Gemmatimonadaceae bacterium]|nr:PIG-L family deacetylase [Gemmatimonadaceae bacterium]
MRRVFLGVAAVMAATFALPRVARSQGLVSLDDAVSSLSVPMRVLVIAAHPDDEDTQLITWLARGRHVETAYLSLTRGDGGQNLLGNELGEALGAIRTEELLAARRLDGGKQFFTRAFDFGFSKTSDETFRHWPKDSVLRDVVTAVRSFKPHVIVSMFSGTPRDGHGHHQAAGILAREAYDAAADTVRFPRPATANLGPWTPLKFYRGAWGARDQPDLMAINVGQYDPMIGRSYAEVAAESRSQHKSQAFGSLQPKGVRFTQVRREASRVNESQAAATEKSLFDGIDTTWARFRFTDRDPVVVAMLDSLAASVAAAQASPYLRSPAAAVAPLRRLAVLLRGQQNRTDRPTFAPLSGGRPVPLSPDLAEALRVQSLRTSRALMLASGIAVEAEAERAMVAEGDSVSVRLTVYNRGSEPVDVRTEELRACTSRRPVQGEAGQVAAPGTPSPNVLLPDSARTWRAWICTGEGTITAPYWLAGGRNGDLFRRGSVVLSEAEMTVGDILWVTVQRPRDATAREAFDIATPIVYRYADALRGDVSRPLARVPEVAVTLDRAIEYAPARTPLVRQLRVELRSAATSPRDVKVALRLPAGLRADSASRTVKLPEYGAVRSATFTVRGELPPGRHTLAVVAEANGKRFTTGYTAIEYDHIRPQRLYREASVAIEAVDLKVPADAVIAYIQGVGDNSAAMLQQLGLRVTVLSPTDIPKTDLSRYNAIVVGTRAYESNDALRANNAALLDYVKRGGTMVVQYGQTEMQDKGIMPFPITLSRPADRVTDESSPIRILDSKARVLAFPNAIDSADFRGWIQDRSLYMPRTHAPEYAGVLATNDPGEPANDGAVLVAKYGEGTYVYTTLAFFRQLPNGVPGAARLFVNLLSAKAPEKSVVP